MKNGIKIEKGIYYVEKVDTYYVHQSISKTKKTVSFPTLQEARAFRDECYKLNNELKIKEARELALKLDDKYIQAHIDYPENLYNALKIDVDSLSNECYLNALNDFSYLSDREKEFISNKYQLEKTLEEIGQIYGLTRERVRQIINVALQKIRHRIKNFEREKLIKDNENEIKEYRKKIFDEFVRTGVYGKEQELVFGAVRVVNKSDSVEELDGLENLDLSVRSYNCLRRYGVHTISQLLKLQYPDEYYKIRNLGKKSVKEIITKLHDRGYMISGLDCNLDY